MLIIEFSKRKDAANIRKHGISLSRAAELDFNTALEFVDDSRDYGEERIIAVGFISDKLYVLVYTESGTDTIRAISLRKATSSERKLHAENQD